MSNKKIFILIIALLVLGTIASVLLQNGTFSSESGDQYDQFATCVKDSGAVFYGAFWCSHCNATKKQFGLSAELLPYVECSTPNATGQIEECKNKSIMAYPTWEFADGSRLEGEVSLEKLSEKTSCLLPSN